MEFMRAAAADGAGVGCHSAELQAEAGKDAAVGFVHHLVGLFQAVEIGMERVGVFHQEFAGAHHAETWPHFIAEFGLDLVEI